MSITPQSPPPTLPPSTGVSVTSTTDFDAAVALASALINSLQTRVSSLEAEVFPPPPPPPPPATGPVVPDGYHQLYLQQGDLSTVNTWNSAAVINANGSPNDTDNKSLQTPQLASNTFLAADPLATNGTSLQMHVRAADYPMPGGNTAHGLTAARCTIGPVFALAGTRVEARVRSSGDGKFADMVFPNDGTWHWEIDFRERFNGSMNLSVNHHADLGLVGGAKPQIHVPIDVDATVYHVFGVEFFTKDRHSISSIAYFLDGQALPLSMPGTSQLVTAITDPKWLPTQPLTGQVSIGSAIPPHRSAPAGYDSYDAFDWVQVLQAI